MWPDTFRRLDANTASDSLPHTKSDHRIRRAANDTFRLIETKRSDRGSHKSSPEVRTVRKTTNSLICLEVLYHSLPEVFAALRVASRRPAHLVAAETRPNHSPVSRSAQCPHPIQVHSVSVGSRVCPDDVECGHVSFRPLSTACQMAGFVD